MNNSLDTTANENTGDIVISDDNLKAITVKGLGDYYKKFIYTSLVAGKRLYKHVASDKHSDMFMQLNVSANIKGIQTLTGDNTRVHVDVLMPDSPMLWDMTIHVYAKGNNNNILGSWSSVIYKRVKFQVLMDTNLTLSFVRYNADNASVDLTPSQSQLLASMTMDVMLKHTAKGVTTFMNVLKAKGKFDSRQAVMGKDSNPIYHAFKSQ